MIHPGKSIILYAARIQVAFGRFTVSVFPSNFLISYILRLNSYSGHAGEESMFESTVEEEFQCSVITYVTGFLKCSGPMVQNP